MIQAVTDFVARLDAVRAQLARLDPHSSDAIVGRAALRAAERAVHDAELAVRAAEEAARL